MVTSNEILASLSERYDSISGKISFADFISSGLHSLDERLAGGFQKGKLYVFSGPNSVAKTSLAISIISYIISYHSAYQKRILFSSYSPAYRIMEKLLAQKTQIDQEKIQRGKLETDEWKALFDQGVKPLKNTSLIIDESIGATIFNLEDNSSQYFKGKNPNIIIIDGLKQFLDLNELNLSIDIAEISKKLKRIAISMNIPVVIFSEEIELLEYSGRLFETRKFELQDNCTFEKEADVVIQICRIENYNHLEMKSEANTEGVYLKITKNQTGLLDTFKFIPFFHILKFNEADYGSL